MKDRIPLSTSMHARGLVTALALVALAVAPGVRGAKHIQCTDGKAITDPKLGALSECCNNGVTNGDRYHYLIRRAGRARHKRWSHAQGAKALDLRSAFRRLCCDISSEVKESRV